MTMTLELIEALEGDTDELAGLDEADRLELLGLAKRGLATMPRPISEAPKDGTLIARKYIYAIHPTGILKLAYWDDDQFGKRPRPFWNYMTGRTNDSRDYQPTHFIPISALDFKP